MEEIEKPINNIDIPKPPSISAIEHLKQPLPKHGDMRNPKIGVLLKFYSIPIILLLALIGIIGGMVFFKVNFVYIIIVGLFTFPIFFVSLIILIIRFYLDRHLVTGQIISNISKNYIRAEFLLPQRRSRTLFKRINKDGLTFSIGKQDYVIDSEAIITNEHNQPKSFYLPNIPLPLKFNYEPILKEFSKAFGEGKEGLKRFREKYDNIVDFSLSSENLNIIKRNNLFKPMLQHTTPEQMKIIIGLIIVLGIAFIAILVIVIIR